VIERPSNQAEAWLVDTVHRLSDKAGLPRPEVAIYEGAPNGFATGPSKSNSLVAVSTGLMQSMNDRQVEAVLAHEVSHIANGDMVTLTLIQGVVNTFVIFISRALAYVVDNYLGQPILYMEKLECYQIRAAVFSKSMKSITRAI